MKEKFIVAILDDDRIFVELLKSKANKIANKHNFDFEIICFNELVEFDVSVNVFDLLFLDVEFPDQNCFQWIRKWQQMGKVGNVIFVSAYDEYVFQSFESQPIAFVRKVHLDMDLERAIALYKEKRIVLPVQIPIWEGRKIHFFETDNILYIQGCGHYIEFHLKDEDTKVLRGKMNEMEKILKPYGFVRVQVRYLVNVRYITGMSHDQITIKNGERFRISPKYSTDIFEQLRNFMTRDENQYNGLLD